LPVIFIDVIVLTIFLYLYFFQFLFLEKFDISIIINYILYRIFKHTFFSRSLNTVIFLLLIGLRIYLIKLWCLIVIRAWFICRIIIFYYINLIFSLLLFLNFFNNISEESIFENFSLMIINLWDIFFQIFVRFNILVWLNILNYIFEEPIFINISVRIIFLLNVLILRLFVQLLRCLDSKLFLCVQIFSTTS